MLAGSDRRETLTRNGAPRCRARRCGGATLPRAPRALTALPASAAVLRPAGRRAVPRRAPRTPPSLRSLPTQHRAGAPRAGPLPRKIRPGRSSAQKPALWCNDQGQSTALAPPSSETHRVGARCPPLTYPDGDTRPRACLATPRGNLQALPSTVSPLQHTATHRETRSPNTATARTLPTRGTAKARNWPDGMSRPAALPKHPLLCEVLFSVPHGTE